MQYKLSKSIPFGRLWNVRSSTDILYIIYVDSAWSNLYPRLREKLLLTLSVHAREGYSSHFVCQSVSQSVILSVCHFFILEKAPFSGLKLTSVHSR